MTSYRQDIDGLRAIAVLAVLFYHLDLPYFHGGYVGVDVFFVISGFLITQLIRNEVLQTGSFNFSRFAIRRVKRLFPAFFVVATLSFAAAVYLFAPNYLTGFAASLVAAMFSVSNIYFYSTAGYFDTASITKPLLHTWSLSLEEQFYLLWAPVLVFALHRLRDRAAFVLVLLLAAVSLGLSVYFRSERSMIYFLLPFRAFELLIGASLVWLQRWVPRDERARDAGTVIGLACIAVGVFAFNERTFFPSYNALLPCAGAALLILSGAGSRAAKLYDNSIAAGVGLISYSLYLVHWPLIVFYSYGRAAGLMLHEKVLLAGVAMICAVALYGAVERPLRRQNWAVSRTGWQTASAFALAVAILVIPAISAQKDGWLWRYPDEIADLLTPKPDAYVLTTRPKGCLLSPTKTFSDMPKDCYLIRKNGRPNIMVVGDSTAYALTTGLMVELGDRYNLYAFTTASCPPVRGYSAPNSPNCAANNAKLFESVLSKNRYDLVIFSSFTRFAAMRAHFPQTAETMRRLKMPFVLVGSAISYTDAPSSLVARHGRIDDLAEYMAQNMGEANCTGENGLDKLVPPNQYFSVISALCRDGRPIYRDGDQFLHRDYVHLTNYGSVYFAKRFVGWLAVRGHISKTRETTARHVNAEHMSQDEVRASQR